MIDKESHNKKSDLEVIHQERDRVEGLIEDIKTLTLSTTLDLQVKETILGDSSRELQRIKDCNY